MTPGPPVLREVIGLLHELGMRARAQAHARLVAHGLTLPMAITLRLLDRPMAMGELADRLACDASYMTGIADRLEAKGLVERRADPSDRRIRQLALTAEGARFRREMADALTAGAGGLAALTTEELHALARLLRKALDAEV